VKRTWVELSCDELMAPLGLGVLHAASLAGDVSKLCLALLAGAEVDTKDDHGRTALWHASANGHEGAVRLLLEAGAAVDAADNELVTALGQACAAGHESTVRMLLQAGAAVGSKSMFGATALLRASSHGHVGAMRMLVDAGAGAEVDWKDTFGMSSLQHASAGGHEGAVRVLLGARAAIDAADNDWVTALGHACAGGHEGVVRLLVRAGAAVDSIDQNGRSALMLAGSGGHEGAVRFMLEARAAVDVKDNDGGSALQHASAGGHESTVRLLLGAEAMVDATDQSGATALVTAIGCGHLDLARVLLEAGVEPPPYEMPPRGQFLGPEEVQMHRLLADYRDERRAELARVEARQRREAAAAAAADALLAVEEAERSANPPPVVTVPAEEVLRALAAAGSDGEVGEGGFGKVFAAELSSLAARWGRVAVKRASGLHAADILREVATLSLCCHCNVLPLLGYCDDARAPCMITPLMHGGSLDDRLLLSAGALERLRRLGFEGDAGLDWQRRLSTLCDAARGLAHLHGERILHRDVKTANILLEGALRPLRMTHGPPLLVHRAVLSDVGLAKVREPTLGGATTYATSRNLAFSMGFVDPTLVNSNQYSEKTDAFGIGICVLMSLVGEPAAGLMKGHEDDVCEAFEDGTGPLFGTARAVAGWPSDATRALAGMVRGLSMVWNRKRQPLPEALAQMEALLGCAATVGYTQTAAAPHPQARAPAHRAGEGPRPQRSRRGPMPSVTEAGASAPSSQPLVSSQSWPGGGLTRMVQQLELGDADAPLARRRARVTRAYDSMMVRLERAHAGQGHAPVPMDEQELRKIDLLAPRHLGQLNGLAHTLRKWWNGAKHQRDQWVHPPSDREVQRLVRDVIAELDGLGW